MNRRNLMIGAGALGAVSILSCSNGKPPLSDRAVAEARHLSRDDTIQALRAPKGRRPLVAILADNAGSETTDLIIPWSILKRSGVADVVILSTQPGDVQLMPALKIRPDLTLTQFNATHATGADYVIVPAFHNPKNDIARQWLLGQAALGSTIIGICSGALVLAHAGLLAGRHATTHWYDRRKLARISPTTKLQLNSRYVADAGVATTTGVSASLPFSLTLVEAISGKVKADQVAAAIGVREFGQEHDSAQFQLSSRAVLQVVSNAVRVFGHEHFGVSLGSGFDELELAFAADAWSRTYRSKCLTHAVTKLVSSSNGLKVLPDLDVSEGSSLPQLPDYNGLPAMALAFNLERISDRFGRATAELVALQLEYDWPKT